MSNRRTDRATAKAERQRSRLDEAERRVERQLDHARRRIEDAERRAEAAAGPIWARPEPGARRARFTREQIAEAALKIADAEGIEALSMRRVASELGAGTMTLYHYVSTKDELIALMDNAIMGELLIPEGELPSDWRAALTLIAQRTRDSFARHPWAFEATGGAQLGPNGIRHVEQSVAALAGLDIDDVTRFEIIWLVDEYVIGYALRNRLPGPEEPEARKAWFEHATDYFDEQVATGEYPHLSELMPDGGMAEFWRRLQASGFDDTRFDRGLQRVLDGIELSLERG